MAGKEPGKRMMMKAPMTGSCEIVKKAIPFLVEGSLEELMAGAIRDHAVRCQSCGELLRSELEWVILFAEKKRVMDEAAGLMFPGASVEAALVDLKMKLGDSYSRNLFSSHGEFSPEFQDGSLQSQHSWSGEFLARVFKVLLAVSFVVLLIFGSTLVEAVIPSGAVIGIGVGIFGAFRDEFPEISRTAGAVLPALGAILPLLGLYVILGLGTALTVGKPDDCQPR